MKTTSAFLLTALFVSGCASVAVTSSSIEDRTASALGIDKSEFTISNRRDDGVRTDYNVQTKTGTQYNCYVTGVVSMIGRTVSDAICTPIASSTSTDTPAAKKSSSNNPACNALLKAAGKC